MRQVVGEVVEGETLVKNEELVKDQVLTYSDGFIPEHKVTSETHDNGLFRVGIRAKVQRRSVIMKLKAANITLKNLDGQSIYGSIVTQAAAEKDAAALVAKALEGFPDNYLEARVVGEPRMVAKTGSEAALVVNVEVTSSLTAYRTFAAKFCQTLNASCKLKGEFTSVFFKESCAQRLGPGGSSLLQGREDDEYLSIHSSQFGSVAGGYMTEFSLKAAKWIPELRQAGGTNASWASVDFVVAVATFVSGDSSRVNWNYYVLDEAVGDVLLRATSRQVTCKLSFLDADGQLVCVERFDLRDDVSPDLGYIPPGARNPWKEFLVICWSNVTGTLASIHERDRDERPPRLAFVAPFLFGHVSGFLGYVPKLTLPRKVNLSLDELRKVAKVKCELTFRAGSDDKTK